MQGDVDRYFAAGHAMQTGVKLDHERGSTDGTPKHLRVGINSRAVDHTGLVKLLIAKGILTEDEYQKAIADEMEEEVERYRSRLNLPPNVSLG
jgi:hypothetical protein